MVHSGHYEQFVIMDGESSVSSLSSWQEKTNWSPNIMPCEMNQHAMYNLAKRSFKKTKGRIS